MVTYRQLERELVLVEDVTTSIIVDPNAEITWTKGQQGNMVYRFPVIDEGKSAFIRGGARLYEAFVKAGCVEWTGLTHVRITPTGASRTLDREYNVSRVD